ncbi:MAG: hypothetical protein MJ132_06215 [Clostridia bacterium]|nr:hypothetical protein [Clostridia bacterium]
MEAFQDVFFEQLIAVKRTGGDWFKLIGIWVLAIVLSLFFIFFAILGAFGVIVAGGVMWGEDQLWLFFTVEYEYAVTNGDLDVAKILGRSNRKFQLSMDLSKADRLEKYKPGMEDHATYKKIVRACDKDAQDAYFLVVTEEAKGTRALIFTPNKRLQQAIVKGLPKFLAISAFKD